MDYDLYKRALAYEEGFRDRPYQDHVGNWTVGYGFNLQDIEMPRQVADHWLQLEMEGRERDLYEKIFSPALWAFMAPARRAALMSMHYQLGAGGFREFKDMIRHIKNNEWKFAAMSCMDSKAARDPQLRPRYRRHAEALETGKVPKEWI